MRRSPLPEQVRFRKRGALRRPREPTANPELCPLFVRQPARVATNALLYQPDCVWLAFRHFPFDVTDPQLVRQ